MWWNRRTGVNAGLTNISHRRALYHIPDRESLYRFILRYCTRAIGAAHEADVATALFISATISSFLCLERERIQQLVNLNCPSAILYREFRYSMSLTGVHLPDEPNQNVTHHVRTRCVALGPCRQPKGSSYLASARFLPPP
jgi:hypothetical protein